jgi:hypothetical protein
MKWEARSNGAGKRHWFLSRETAEGTEYHWSANGWLVRYASYATACRAASKLNLIA